MAGIEGMRLGRHAPPQELRAIYGAIAGLEEGSASQISSSIDLLMRKFPLLHEVEVLMVDVSLKQLKRRLRLPAQDQRRLEKLGAAVRKALAILPAFKGEDDWSDADGPQN